jgi:hypothetical protein
MMNTHMIPLGGGDGVGFKVFDIVSQLRVQPLRKWRPLVLQDTRYASWCFFRI